MVHVAVITLHDGDLHAVGLGKGRVNVIRVGVGHYLKKWPFIPLKKPFKYS